jgi:hypothetical protein
MEKKHLFMFVFKTSSFSLSKRSPSFIQQSDDVFIQASNRFTAPRGGAARRLEILGAPAASMATTETICTARVHRRAHEHRSANKHADLQQRRASKSATSKPNLLVFSPSCRGFSLAEIGALWD